MAFKRGLIETGDVGMRMVKSRTLTFHTYNEEVAEEIADAIYKEYYPEFLELQKRFKKLEQKEQQ